MLHGLWQIILFSGASISLSVRFWSAWFLPTLKFYSCVLWRERVLQWAEGNLELSKVMRKTPDDQLHVSNWIISIMPYVACIRFSLAVAKKYHITQVGSEPWSSGPQIVLDNVGQGITWNGHYHSWRRRPGSPQKKIYDLCQWRRMQWKIAPWELSRPLKRRASSLVHGEGNPTFHSFPVVYHQGPLALLAFRW